MKHQGKHESNDYPNFYHVPGLPATLINEHGNVIDTGKNWCPLHDINPDGYPCVNSDNNRRFIHRMLALTFLPDPDEDTAQLEVNHIDGIKANYAIDNLEWTTYSENVLHAYKNGLRTDNTPILVKDLRDGSVVRYYSLRECARAFDKDGAVIHWQLKPTNYGRISWKYYVFIREGQEWPEIDPEDIGKFRNGSAKEVHARSTTESCSMLFESVGEAARHLGIKPATLRMHIFRNGEKPFRGWSFRFINDVEKVSVGLETKTSPTW